MTSDVHDTTRRHVLLQGARLAVATTATADAMAAAPAPAPPALRTEYAMTLHAPLHAPQAVGRSLLVFHARPGGTLQGLGWSASVENPTGDWVRVLDNGNMRIDVRLSARLDDGEMLYMSYGGLLKKPDAASWARFMKGERISAPEWYYVITPLFETGSPQYAWLNDVQAVGRFVSIQTGEQAHVRFDIHVVR